MEKKHTWVWGAYSIINVEDNKQELVSGIVFSPGK